MFANSISMIARVVLIIIIIALIYVLCNYFLCHVIVIEPKEHMDNVNIYDVEYSNWKKLPDPNPKPLKFYVKGDRYNTSIDNKQNNIPYDGARWSPYYLSGPNYTGDDNTWHYTSPKMTVQRNNYGCRKSDRYDEPMGYASGLTSYYDESMVNGVVRSDILLHDEFLPQELATGYRYMKLQNPNNTHLDHACLNNIIGK